MSDARPAALPALTGLRFLAAAAIVIHHTSHYFGIGTSIESNFTLSQGVSFFFVLSGFILFYAYASLQYQHGAGRFLLARVARIWPVHLVTLLSVFLLSHYVGRDLGSAAAPRSDTVSTLLNAFLLQAWTSHYETVFAYNGPSWSISDEAFFYLLFPLLVWRWEKRWPLWLALGLATTLSMIWLVAAWPIALRGWNTVGLSGILVLHSFPPTRLLEFMGGMLAASLWLRRRYFLTLSATHATLLEIAALSLTALSMHYVVHAQGHTGAAFGTWFGNSGSFPVFALLIVVFAAGRGLVSRLLGSAPLVLLGEISFSLYLSHEILIKADLQFFRHHAAPALPWHYAGYWTAALLTAWLLWRGVEMPCRRLILHISAHSRLRWPAWRSAGRQVDQESAVAMQQRFD